jgi:anaerobic selenocysteine-containing dehydrogenase
VEFKPALAKTFGGDLATTIFYHSKAYTLIDNKHNGHDAQIARSTCCYCGVGCGIIVRKDKNGSLNLSGDPDHPVNKGMLCSKGMNLHYTVIGHKRSPFVPGNEV